MAKAKPDRVNPHLAKRAIEAVGDRRAAYSQCVILSYQSTGRLAPGFDNKDLQAWIDINYPRLFDQKGKKISGNQ